MKRYGRPDAIVTPTLPSYRASVFNHVNLERHLYPRQIFKQNRDAAQAKRQSLYAN